MARIKYATLLLAALLAASPSVLTQKARPGPSLLSGNHALGMVMPQLSGWGWSPQTTPPPTPEPTTTPGWTTPPPTTTLGWTTELPTTTPGWTTPPPTTTPPPETTTTPGWTTPPPTPPPTTTPGWTVPPPTTTPGWNPVPPPPAPPGWGWAPPSGWGPPTGWYSPPPPPPTSAPVIIEIVGESAVVGEGEVGATHGSETSASGDASNPASAVINTGSYSSLGQGSGVLQISGVNAQGESNTFQGIDGYNFGDSGEYYGGSLSGNQINTLNGGGSFVLGQGAIGQGGFTLNNSPIQVPPGFPGPHHPYGWKKEDDKEEKEDDNEKED